MICPSCEYEYVDGISVCPDCKTELITVDAFEGNLVNPSDWVILCNCNTGYEAEMLKSNLEGANIETLILDQRDRSFPTDGDLKVIKLLVKKSDAETAVAIKKDIDKNSDNIEEE